ncbi:MAG TPA: hypothetical protein VJ438_00490, partial [Candidatus Nanoarchaeia archaeon]|nr:hypothetical protein [Candidatus Nanoarchaeia archaeon]
MNSTCLREWEKVENNEVSKLLDSYYQEVSVSKTIGDFEKRNIFTRNNWIFNYGNNVGILELGNENKECVLELRPKLDQKETKYFWNFLPRMLNQLCDFEDFNEKLFMDPKRTIELPKGCNMVPLLTLSFVSLCQKVIEKGMIRKYVKKNERLTTLKGKIDFPKLVKDKPFDLSKIPCSYYDLTFDNPENQLVLWCAHKLISETRKIKSKNMDQ